MSIADRAAILPTPGDSRLTREVAGEDESGAAVSLAVVEERPLTIFLNAEEIVTAMTVGDYPEYLALGYLLNQRILRADDKVNAIDYDDELGVVVVRAEGEGVGRSLGRRVRTSGCAEGTVFESFMEEVAEVRLADGGCLKVSDFYHFLGEIARVPSLYLRAGAIHGTALARGRDLLVFFEDVGRHNAVDKVAGWMASEGVAASDKWLYTTGRLTSEMVLKSVQMGVPVVASRSGFTHAGVEMARRANLTLIGRARGHRFTVLSGGGRLKRDAEVSRGRV
ncbi:MAG: formate dehydrogenase accessory sulfurtransferase FdhD [Alphaproteobacteria bacterium]|nr:formate dehydrogenase accessory sulfurtransferase FdhD [Alphaproteobacteria bacterium]